LDLLPLFAWLSPAYPTGAYAYSHGLEHAVESGAVRDVEALVGWLGAVLRFGAGRNDAILFRAAHAAAADSDALIEVDALARALAPSRERHAETVLQGRAFLDTTRAAWPSEAMAALGAALPGPVAYPVAVGAAVAARGLAVRPALDAMLLAFAANLCSGAVRLVPLGQTDGQRAVARLAPVAHAVADATEGATLDDLGGCAFMADIAALKHETQDGRLFRS
jgi:urease accessory protein